MAGRRIFRLAVSLAAIGLVLSGCGADNPSRPTPTTPAPTPARTDVIGFTGLPGVAIGASLRDLTASGAVTTAGPGCGPAFASIPAASPVFDGDELVLMWAYPPMRTPENVGVGSSIEDVRTAYPTATEVTPPAGSHQYPGLLVTGPADLAYLILLDQGQVQKLIVGRQRYARMLLDNGFGAC